MITNISLELKEKDSLVLDLKEKIDFIEKRKVNNLIEIPVEIQLSSR